ncbi:uncharacterized protein LOC135353405 [Latimeria chalumnae]|uniref:uncharacterized protein LOC135353405 n=1 Tax=Latimeria chalumnae TaxID=7897 RepID=UPI00313EEFB2
MLEENVPAVTQFSSPPIIAAEGVTDMLQQQDMLPALVKTLVQAAIETTVEAVAEEEVDTPRQEVVIPVLQVAEAVGKPAMQERQHMKLGSAKLRTCALKIHNGRTTSRRCSRDPRRL